MSRNRAARFLGFLGFLASLEFFVYLAVAGLLWAGIAMGATKQGLWDVAGFLPARVFFGLMAANRLFGLALEIYRRKNTAVLTVGIIIALGGLAVNYIYRFEAVEQMRKGQFLYSMFGFGQEIQTGPRGKTPDISLSLTEAHGDILSCGRDATGEFRVAAEGPKFKTRLFEVGKPQRLSTAMKMRLESLEPLPRILITDKTGRELFSAEINLRLCSEQRDFFNVLEMPYRVYLGLNKKGEEKQKPFSLLVLRDKLTVKKADFAPGDEVEFEGLKLSITQMTPWATVKVDCFPGNRVVLAGLMLIIAGGAIALVSRAETKPGA